MLQFINYILLDAARMESNMDTAQKLNSSFDSLYRGGSEESLSGVAPYLFSFKHDTLFTSWFIEKGWGDSWGLMVKTSLPMQEVHKHFRKFLLVKTEDGEELYFRFYDPRVLRIFLPTCDRDQIFEFFGKIDYFFMEDEDPAWAIKFWQENGQLRQSKIAKEDLNIVQFDEDTFAAKMKEFEVVEEDTVMPEISNTQAPPSQTQSVSSTISTSSQEPKTNEPKVSATDQPVTTNKSKWNLFD